MGGCLLLAMSEMEIHNKGLRTHLRLEMEASHLLLDEREEQSFPPSSNSMCSKGCSRIQLGWPHDHSYPPKMVSWRTV